MDPLFWLGVSILLVAVSITAVLMAALPAFQELSRAARSAEKLFDTLNRELPPTLEAIRLTSLEITELTDDMTEGVQNVGRMTQQMDQGVSGVKQQAKQANITTRSVVAGVKAAFSALARPSSRRATPVPTRPRLPVSQVEEFEEIEEVDEMASFESESVTISVEQHRIRSEVIPSENSYENSHADRERILSHADQNHSQQITEHPPVESTESHHAERQFPNGNPSPQLRPSSLPQLNLPKSSSPEMPSIPVEAQRDRQS